ncbi:hypothetical protein Sru01_54830 [Sphaerisporangium rufum]|uniref:Uncharacterized protein n=1 Tax=Sphaerisporangium rufum TaxID=1381558 RepID=A0A919V0W4_9ACTN|nr:hypothetical protein [Sphaerisporangium rufum]GII80501.1 hypothetical protein Sru01_54830 [Sphaerisporangium rufum]
MTTWARRVPAAAVAAVTMTAFFTATFPETAMGAVRSSAASQAPGTAVNLKVTDKVRHALADAFWNQYYGKPGGHRPVTSRKKVDGPKKVYYGKVRSGGKTVYWAVGSIGVRGDLVSYQDGPHVWRRSAHGAWSYRGDTGGCLEKAPKSLLKLWRLRSYC